MPHKFMVKKIDNATLQNGSFQIMREANKCGLQGKKIVDFITYEDIVTSMVVVNFLFEEDMEKVRHG